MPAFDVIVCGSLHLDILVYARDLPRLDETAVGTRWEMQCGGKGGNQAVMAARAGARTAMIGSIGADDFGARLRAHLTSAQVDDRAVLVDGVAGSGMSAAIVRDDGEYGAVIVSGANLKMAPAVAARAWRDMGAAKVLVLQNEIPQDVNAAVAAAARESGALVILNAAPARALTAELQDALDVLVVNRVEAEAMSERSLADPFAVIEKLGTSYRNVIITLGGGGLLVKASGAAAVRIAPKPVKVVSTHGAGDCFLGSLAAKLADAATLVEAAEFANAVAAAHVARQPAETRPFSQWNNS